MKQLKLLLCIAVYSMYACADESDVFMRRPLPGVIPKSSESSMLSDVSELSGSLLDADASSRSSRRSSSSSISSLSTMSGSSGSSSELPAITAGSVRRYKLRPSERTSFQKVPDRTYSSRALSSVASIRDEMKERKKALRSSELEYQRRFPFTGLGALSPLPRSADAPFGDSGYDGYTILKQALQAERLDLFVASLLDAERGQLQRAVHKLLLKTKKELSIGLNLEQYKKVHKLAAMLGGKRRRTRSARITYRPI